MAQQIRAGGGVIDRFIMIDPPVAPGTRGQRLSRHARDLFRHSPGKAIKLLANRLWITLFHQLRDLTVWLPEIGRDKSLPVLNREQRRQMNELTTAFKSYRPKRYEGSVTIISCADSRRVHGDSMLGWAHLFTGPITTLEMTGTHHSMIREPVVQELAAHMMDCLGE
jgi:thioesterase domain-containing protein